MRGRSGRAAALLAPLLAASGCDSTPRGLTPADTVLSDWTAGVVDREPAAAGMGTLESVRAARHAGFDRVAWQLSELPGVHVEYVDEPVHDCGTGNPVPLPGDGWLEVRLEPARAHTDEGRPTVPERRIATRLPVVLEIARTCNFEGVVTYVLATGSPERFRVIWLDDPPRVVVDVRHPVR